MLNIYFLQKIKEKKNYISSFTIHFFLILLTLQNYELNKKVTPEKYSIIEVQIYSSSRDHIPEANSNDNIDAIKKKSLIAQMVQINILKKRILVKPRI